MFFILTAHSFSFSVLGNVSKGFIKAKDLENEGKPGWMLGLGLEMGYRFDLKNQYFVEWNFLSLHGSVNGSYFDPKNGFSTSTMHPIEGVSRAGLKGGISGDISITQLQIGKFVTPMWSVYGIVDPLKVFAANISATCSNIPNLGVGVGLGTRYWISKYCALSAETRFYKSYAALEYRKDVSRGKFESKLSIFRVLLGMHISKRFAS